MAIFEKLKETVHRMDLLCTSPSFRTRGQSNYETTFGGILSLIVMVGFGVIFYSSFIKVLNQVDISFSTGTSDDVTSTSGISKNIHIAIGIDDIDLSATPYNVMVQLRQRTIDITSGTPVKTNSLLTLAPCNLSDWKDLGTNFQHQFNAFGMSQMLCIPSTETYSVSGYAGSNNFDYLQLQVVACNQTFFPLCDTSANVNTFMSNHLSTNSYFKTRFIMVDTIFTPDNAIPYTKVLEKDMFMAFSTTLGTVGHLNIGEFQVTSDESIWPVVMETSETGIYIEDYRSNSVSIHGAFYVDFKIFRSTKATTISRSVGKIDSLLSYVGGLISLLFVLISWCFSSYSQHKYELYIAHHTLTLDQSGKKVKQSDYNFLHYMVYAMYDWFDFFGIEPKCLSKYKQIHETRAQVCEQMDPTVMINRIRYLQNVTHVLLNEHKRVCLYLSKPPSIDQLKHTRKMLGYYNNVLEGLSEEHQEELNKRQQMKDYEQMMSQNTGNNLDQKKLGMENDSQMKVVEQIFEQEEDKLIDQAVIYSLNKLEGEQGQIAEKIRKKINERLKKVIKDMKDKDVIQVQNIISPLESEKNQVLEDVKLNKRRIKIRPSK